jgi:hypothetical protein
MLTTNYFANPENYNSDYFPAVYDAALAIASPFLVQQQNQTIEGVTISGNQAEYNGNTFTVHTDYINPGNGYYIPTPPAFTHVWQTQQFPNAAFDGNTNTFTATIDCVGFGSRVLVATADSPNNPQTNAFCIFHSQVDFNAMHFASPGWVPTAFEFAIAIPCLLQGRWSYVAGSVNTTAIQSQESTDKDYNGLAKGGFSGAQAGDIVCLAYEDAGSNGHFMVLTATPQPADLSLFTDLPSFVTNAYTISVYDSTASGFSLHFNDSRLNDNDSGCGVGYGQLYFFTNDGDEPVGFIFGPSGSGMEEAHFLYGLMPLVPKQLLVAAISVGRFQ